MQNGLQRSRWLAVAAGCFMIATGHQVARAAYLPLPPLGHADVPLDSRGMLTAQSRFAYGLITNLAHRTHAVANIMVSPAGAATILALIDLGASAKLRAAIYHTLRLPLPANARRSLDLSRVRRAVASVVRRSEQSGPLAFANSLIFDPSSRPNPNALLALAAAGADVEVEHLSTRKALTQINDWVRERTGGLIPSILDAPPRNVQLVALDALYFADGWRVPFDPAETEREPFQSAANDVAKVAMMHLDSGTYRFRMNRRFIAVDLPYASPGYSMVVITTRNAPARPRAFAAVAGWLSGAGFDAHPGELALPKFTLSDRRSLLSALDSMGLRRGRTTAGALGGLSAAPLQLSRIVERTEIKVDEKGTLAAATTMVEAQRSAIPGYVKMTVDKPFMFALRDQSSGLILIAGYFQRPR